MALLDLPEPTTLPIETRVRIAQERGEDIIRAIIDDKYGSDSIIRDLGIDGMVEDFRRLYEKSKKTGLEEDQKALLSAMLLYCPDIFRLLPLLK